MTRQIKITQIPDVMEDAVVFLVAATTSEWTRRVKKATPVVTGELRNAWQTKITPTKGMIINNKPYAEPVCFGTNLPPSWGGKYRTRQNRIAGFPEIIGKELQQWAIEEYEKIKRKL